MRSQLLHLQNQKELVLLTCTDILFMYNIRPMMSHQAPKQPICCSHVRRPILPSQQQHNPATLRVGPLANSPYTYASNNSQLSPTTYMLYRSRKAPPLAGPATWTSIIGWKPLASCGTCLASQIGPREPATSHRLPTSDRRIVGSFSLLGPRGSAVLR